MAKFLRNKVDVVFWILAIALFLLLASYSVFSIKYLIKEFYEANNPNLIKPPEVVRFNLNKLQDLRK